MLTLRHKIAQMIIIGFDGTELNELSPIAQCLSHEGLGGVLLFDTDVATGLVGKNIKNQTQVRQLIAQLNEYSKKCFRHLPLLTAVDYEGGAVDRLANIAGCKSTMTALELATLSDDALDIELDQMALTLKSLGFNLNFAPIVDLNLNEQEGIIGKKKRSFSANPDVVVRLAAKFVEVFTRHGIACSYKHFPGHGSALGDTHEGFVDVTETFRVEELNPYYQLLRNVELPVMIMTAHVINRHLDSSGLPATLSHKMLTELLRKTIGYNGVIISDDLQMHAIAHHYSLKESLCLTINAGADMVIVANQLGTTTAPEIISCIEELVIEGGIDSARIEEAYQRIVHLKNKISCDELVH